MGNLTDIRKTLESLVQLEKYRNQQIIEQDEGKKECDAALAKIAARKKEAEESIKNQTAKLAAKEQAIDNLAKLKIQEGSLKQAEVNAALDELSAALEAREADLIQKEKALKIENLKLDRRQADALREKQELKFMIEAADELANQIQDERTKAEKTIARGGEYVSLANERNRQRENFLQRAEADGAIAEVSKATDRLSGVIAAIPDGPVTTWLSRFIREQRALKESLK